jgi:hypothetical protein
MTDKQVERVVVIDHAETARRDAEARLNADPAEAERFRNTIPGGKYGTADGRFVDAHGPLVGEPQAAPATPATMQLGGPEVTDAAKAQADGAEGEAWRKDMLEQRRESADNPVEGAPVVAFTTLPPLDDDEVDEAGTKTGRKVKRAAKKRSR